MKKSTLITWVLALMLATSFFVSAHASPSFKNLGLHEYTYGVNDLRITQADTLYSPAQYSPPKVVASFNTGGKVDKVMPEKSNHIKWFGSANTGADGLISYPESWSRKGVYINDDGFIASCYAPRSATDNAKPDGPINHSTLLAAKADATFWQPLAPG